MRILILSFDSLGDLVLRQPLLRALADSGHELGIALRAPLLELLPFLDARLQAVSTSLNPYLPPGAFEAGDARGLLEEARRFAPDILVSTPFNRTGLDDWLLGRFADRPRFGLSAAGAKVPREILSDPVPCDEWSPEEQKYRLLYKAVSGRELGEGMPALVLSGDSERRAQTWLREHELAPDQYVLGCPGGLQTVGIKGWPADPFVDVVRYIHDRHGLAVLATGGEADADHLGRIAGLAEGRGVRLIRWIGRAEDLGLLLGLIGSSRLYLGADTGPMHFAAALGKPVAALFGGGTWPRFLPQARRSFVAAQKLPCFGCRWNCWLDEAACLSFVPADRFFGGIDWILSGGRDERRVAAAECDGPVLEKLARAGIGQTRRFQDRLREKEAEIRRQAAAAEERGRLFEVEAAESRRLLLEKEGEIRRQAAAAEERGRLLEVEAEENKRLRAQNEELSRLLQDRKSDTGNPRENPPKRREKKSPSKTAG